MEGFLGDLVVTKEEVKVPKEINVKKADHINCLIHVVSDAPINTLPNRGRAIN